MPSRLLVVAMLAALTACSPRVEKSADGEGGAAPQTVVGAVATGLEPGQWRTTLTILEVSMPGLPPAAVARMKARPIVDEDCQTSVDVADFMGKKVVTDEGADACTINTLDHSAGRIVGDATCDDGSGPHAMHIEGAYRSDNVDVTMTVSGQGPQGPMSQKMHMVSQRLGACPA